MGVLEPHGRGRRPFRRDELTADGPVIVVHSLTQAVAALTAAAQAKRPVVLASAPDAGISAGAGWWGALVAAAEARVPAAEFGALLDCGDDAGAAQAAIRAGIEAIVFSGPAAVAERLADIARRQGARLLAARPAPALDLGDEFFASEEELRRRSADLLAAVQPADKLSGPR